MIDFSIPLKLISGNQLSNLHWAAKAELIKEWRNYVRLYSRQQSADARWRVLQPCRFKVIVTRYAARPLDFTNLAHSADKLVVDNIKTLHRKRKKVFGGFTFETDLREGLIYDDAPKYLELELKQNSVSTGFESVRVQIEELPDLPKKKKIARRN